MKYINADKLIAEIERWINKAKEKYNESAYSMGRCDSLAEFRNHIVCFQQEQPEVDLEKAADGTALQKAFVSSKIDYTLEEKCDASDYADAILPTSVTYGESEEEYKLHKIIEAAFIAGQKNEQTPVEWSEGDENAVNKLVGICAVAKRYRQFSGCQQEEITKLQVWLKALRAKFVKEDEK